MVHCRPPAPVAPPASPPPHTTDTTVAPTLTADAQLLASMAQLVTLLGAAEARLTLLAERGDGPCAVGHAEWSASRARVALQRLSAEPDTWPTELSPIHLARSRPSMTPLGAHTAAAWLVSSGEVLGLLVLHGLPSVSALGTRHAPQLIQVTDALARLWDAHTRLEGNRARVLLDRDLSLLGACPLAQSLLDAHGLPLLRTALSTTPWPTTLHLGLQLAHLHRLAGADGDRVLVELEPTPRVRQRPLLVLSERQLQVARLVADGQTDKAIATLLNLCLPTVKSHLQRIYELVGVEHRTALALMVKASP